MFLLSVLWTTWCQVTFVCWNLFLHTFVDYLFIYALQQLTTTHFLQEVRYSFFGLLQDPSLDKSLLPPLNNLVLSTLHMSYTTAA